MTKQIGFLGLDQYGNKYILQKYPRKELMEKLGYRSANKMYVDTKNGKVRHEGYVIGPYWINIFRVCEWKQAI